MPRKTGVPMTCQQCDTSFVAMDHRENRPTRYCSRACRDEAMRTRVELTCRQCGKVFRRKAYMESWSQDRGPFCGFACYGRWQSQNAKGEANPNFRPESPRRGSGQWERNRIAALERDGHRCQDCGATGKRLYVHHQTPWEPNQEDPHALDNLTSLCGSCHRRRHRDLRALAASEASTR
jgi:hypothetical protein